jgi:alkylated DNA repair protein (DNA oxidative demethylase)
MTPVESPPRSGFFHVPGFLTLDEQRELLELARGICEKAPLRRPTMKDGTPLKLRLTNAGDVGWFSDTVHGYHYAAVQPSGTRLWPSIPEKLLSLARSALQTVGLPPMRVDNCLINHYAADGSLGMHIDRTEQDKRAPIISLSVGADAEFVLEQPGYEGERPRKHKFVLRSGDLVVQSGASRGWPHGINQIYPTLPNLCKDGGRINFTLRKVTMP